MCHVCLHSNGASRSGLLVAAMYLVDMMKIEQVVDVFLACRFVAINRPQVVDSMVRRRKWNSISSIAWLGATCRRSCCCEICRYLYCTSAINFSAKAKNIFHGHLVLWLILHSFYGNFVTSLSSIGTRFNRKSGKKYSKYDEQQTLRRSIDASTNASVELF